MVTMYFNGKKAHTNHGITQVWGGDLCTYSDPRFFSYRREPRTGRMASVIWRDCPAWIESPTWAGVRGSLGVATVSG